MLCTRKKPRVLQEHLGRTPDRLENSEKKISEEKSNSKSGEGGERGYYPSEGKWK